MDIPSWTIYCSLILLALIAMSSFFSASETVYSTVNLMRLRAMAEDGNKKAARALDVAENFDQTLSTILVGNNIVNIASSSLATVVATALFGSYGPLISTVVITVLVLIFGEILPKSYAKENSLALSLKLVGILSFLIVILKPVASVFHYVTKLTAKWNKKKEKKPSVTEDELKYIIETIEDEGVLNEQESDLVQSALDFDDITVQEILTPRVDLISLDAGDPDPEILQAVLESPCSRLPVYDKSIDNIIGLLHVRDYLGAIASGRPVVLRELLHPCQFVHRSMKISALMRDFQKTKNQLAVVTDDYGGTVGIVTMEDILEELVGEIWDETDVITSDCVKISDNLYEVSGDMDPQELFEELEIKAKDFDSDYSTMGGWTLEMLERLPAPGDDFTFLNLLITVKEMEDKRITKLTVEILPEAPAGEQEDE